MAFAVVGCNSGTGPDSLSSQKTQGSIPLSSCTEKCHNASSTISPDPLVTNGTGTYGKHIAHVQNTGIPCEKCHANYINAPTHMNGTLDTGPAVNLVFFDSTNPPPAQFDKNAGPPVTGICSNLVCHGPDTLDWYGTGTANFQNCSSCHSYTVGSRRRVTGAQGDFGGNASIVSHHVATTGDPVREQCLVCHDQSTHTAGTVRLRNADTGSSIVYNPVNSASLEPFCISCHDANGASGNKAPFADGRTLGSVPNVAGDKIAGYWSAAYTVHKNKGLTCAGSGAPNTGCHGNNQSINMHGSISKGLLTRNLELPVTPSAPYEYSQYQLCFDCHDNYPAVTKEVVLGYKQGGHYDVYWAPTPYYTLGIQSMFRDRYISDPNNYPAYWGGVNQSYNDSNWGYDPYTPLHNYHLSIYDFFNYGWNYRGVETGRASCVTCHNVHGTNGTVRSIYDEFGIIAFSKTFPGGEVDLYKKLTKYDNLTLKSYPINCNYNCHDMVPGTSYWYAPPDE